MNPLAEPGAIEIDAGELVKQVEAGEKFRLACLPYTFPKTYPDKVNGEWPLIIEADYATSPDPTEILIVTERMAAIGKCYGARSDEKVIVIPA